MKFLDKIRAWPEERKKIVIWSIIILMAIGLGWWWFEHTMQSLGEFDSQKAVEQLDLDKLQKTD
jgi:predicted negative regulator of RcsB-dependent stress response